MAKLSVLNTKGEKIGDITLEKAVFGITPNDAVLYDAITLARNSQRQGTASTKTRSEVSGGGRKPWKQKGTGRARQGSIRAAQWYHGGIVFGPQPRDFDNKRMNRKERKLALRSALAYKEIDKAIVVVDSLAFNEIKTKNMVNALTNLKVEGKTLIVLPEKNENVQKSARNIEGVKTSLVNTINVYDLLKYNKLVLTVDAVKSLEEVYA